MKNKRKISTLVSIIVMFLLVFSTINIQAEPVYNITAQGILDDLDHTRIDIEFNGLRNGVPSGYEYSISFVPNETYEFVRWSNGSTEEVWNGVLPSQNIQLIAYFKLATTDVTVSAQAQTIDGAILDDACTFSGTGDFSEATSTVEYSVNTDTISPKYKFIGWGEDQSPSVGDDREGVLSDGESVNVVAIFELAKYEVNATARLDMRGAILEEHVVLTGDRKDFVYGEGYEVNYQIVDNQFEGYDLVFTGWTDAPRVGNVLGDVTINAWFHLDRYHIHTQAVDLSNGYNNLPSSVVLLPEDSYYHPGEAFDFNFELLDDRYEFVNWTLGSHPKSTVIDPVDNSISGMLTNDLWVQGNFQLKPVIETYSLTVIASENSNSGNIIPEITFTNTLDSNVFQSNVPIEDLLAGYEFDFEVNEDSIREGWSFAGWDQNIYSLDLGPSGSITDHNVLISALFKPNYDVSASVHLVDEDGTEIRLLGSEDGVETQGTGPAMNTSQYNVSLLYNSDDYVLYGESVSNYAGMVWEADVHIDFYLKAAPIVIVPTPAPTTAPTTTSVSRYTLTLGSSEGGSFTLFEGSRRYNRNTYVNVEFEVEDGYRFIGYSDDSDDEDINSSSQIKMNSNKELFAIFEEIVEVTPTPTPTPESTPIPTPTPIEIDEEVIPEDMTTELLDESIAQDVSDSMPEAGGVAALPIILVGLSTSVFGFIVRKNSKDK